MIKVCHMTSAHNPEDDRIFHKECISIAQAGFDTYLVARGDTYQKKGVHIVGIGEVNGGRFYRMTTIAKRIYKKALSIDADIYQIHDPELLPFGLMLKKKGKIVIFDSHEAYSLQIQSKSYLPKMLRWLIGKLYLIVETYIVKKIDAVIVPCTFNGKNIFEGRALKSTYINNYPVLSDFYGKYDSKAEKKGYVCYTGGLTYERGIYHLVKAAYLAKVPLVLAGSYSTTEFSEQIKKLPEYKNVDDRGRVTLEEVASIDRGAIAGICTLLNFGQYYIVDNFSVKIYEYMAMGLPVIVYNYPYARKIMKVYKFGICVKADDIHEIAEAIKYIANNPEDAYKMGQEGRRAIREKFNWNTQAKQLVELYKDLLINYRL